MAFEVVKAMQADGLEWGEGYRPLGRQALEEVIEDQMAAAVDRHLDQLGAEDAADRRNGYYRRHLLTELGDIELNVPRTRRYSPVALIRAYARRAPQIDRVILAGFVLGLSTRKVGETLLALLGRTVSASTVSQVAKTLDGAVAAFHRRPLQNRYQALMLDGVVLARKTGAGALRRPVLVALGLRPDGKKEIIDFRLATSESAAEWEKFLADLYRRGLTGRGLEMICVDGGSGLLAALPTVFDGIPVQRCWAHKIRNVLDKIKKTDQPAAKRALHKIMNAPNAPAARAAARKFANRFEDKYPAAVACLRNDLDELLTCFRYKSENQRRKVRTTNAIERRFREVRRRTRPMGTFQDRTSMDRILFAVFTHENKSQGVSTPFLLTQNN
ncbi:MAG TPA: IS256 family transposase [Xanthobacteraceae bacterium]|nr:IS256 family transposase [Xanthobacteraceae bacterium]